MARTFLIDTDTASDDAVALIMALRASDVQVRAITTVAGNVGVEQATMNALRVVELCGSEAPVFRGAGHPLQRELILADWFHGKDGLGDQGYPEPRRTPEKDHAVDAIIETARANRGLTLVTLGPLTNIALAVAKEPALVSWIGRCVVMGGNAITEGNVTPAAEYNMWVDPEAARMVFRAGLPIEMVGWHLCRGEAVLHQGDIDAVLRLGNPIADFAINCNRTAMAAYRTQTGEVGISLPDPVAMSIALDESIVTSSSDHRVEVETASELTRGMTVIDRLGVSSDIRNQAIWKGAKPASVIWTIDAARWKRLLVLALS